MLIAMLLIAAAPDQQVPERIDAELPPVRVATRGLVADRLPRLEVDLAALLDDDCGTSLAREDSRRMDEAAARLVDAVEEELREEAAAARGAAPECSEAGASN